MSEYWKQMFAYEHLPEHLQQVSRPYFIMANSLCEEHLDNDQREVALQKLLESKDAAVRSYILSNLK